MNRLKIFLISVLTLILSSLAVSGFAADAWTTGYNPMVQKLDQGKLLDFRLTVDGAGTFTSNYFNLQEHDYLSFSTYPITGEYKCTQANDSIAASVIIQGSNYPGVANTWVAVDTIASISDTAATYVSLDMNNKKYKTYRAYIAFTAATGVTATFKLALYLYHPRDER